MQEGAKIGTVKAIIPAGAGDVLEIDRGPGRETLLVPFTKAAVPEINIGAGRLTVDPPRDVDIEADYRVQAKDKLKETGEGETRE